MKPETKEKLKRISRGIGKTLWELVKLALLTEHGPVLYIVTDVAQAVFKLKESNVFRAFVTLGLSKLWEKVKLKRIKIVSVEAAEQDPEAFEQLIAEYPPTQIVFSHDALEALA